MTRHALLFLLVSGCAEPSTPPATAEIPPGPSAPSSSPAPWETAPPTPSAAPDASAGKWEPGRTITVVGRVSREPNQHLVGNVDGKQPEYFDVEGRDQTIVHVAKPIACPGLVSVTGKVFEVRGSSKRPGSKVDDSYAELQLDVTDARCVPLGPP